MGRGPGGWIVFAGELRSMGYLGDAAAGAVAACATAWAIPCAEDVPHSSARSTLVIWGKPLHHRTVTCESPGAVISYSW